MERREKDRRAKEFKTWCEQLDRVPKGYTLKLKDGLIPDLELQPWRWISRGIEILQSTHVVSRVRHLGGREGEPIQSVLPYPVFLSGAELFFKGMWLCRFPACRRVAQKGYLNIRTRRKHDNLLRGLGHDLIGLIKANRRILAYRRDPVSLAFLKRVEALVRCFYYPLVDADKKSGWAVARYPKRFYNDSSRQGYADGLISLPQQRLVLQLFEPMESHLDRLWQLRRGLIERQKKRRKSRHPGDRPLSVTNP